LLQIAQEPIRRLTNAKTVRTDAWARHILQQATDKAFLLLINMGKDVGEMGNAIAICGHDPFFSLCAGFSPVDGA
jgi:hypothetical protein